MAEMEKHEGEEKKHGHGAHKMKHEGGHHGSHHDKECCSGKHEHKHGHEHSHGHEHGGGQDHQPAHQEQTKCYGLLLVGLAIGSAAGVLLTLMMTTRMGRRARRSILDSGSQILQRGEEIVSPAHAADLLKSVRSRAA